MSARDVGDSGRPWLRAARGRGRPVADQGAAVVEFALIVPIMLLLVLGIVEFGRIYNAQISLSAAAREGARVMAVHDDPVDAAQAVIAAAPSLNPPLSTADIAITPASCQPGDDVTVAISYEMELLTGIVGQQLTMTGLGVMRCGG